MRTSELRGFELKNTFQPLLLFALIITTGLAIGEISMTLNPPLALLLIDLGLLLVMLFLSQALVTKIAPLQRILLALTVIAGFIGPAFLTISVGPIHLFPYRILLVLVWVLFLLSVFLKGVRTNDLPSNVKPYLQFMVLWLFCAALSLAWAAAKVDALRDIIFLFMAASIIFFMVYYFTSQRRLLWIYYIWLFVFVALIPIGIWETLSGQHLSVSGLAQTTHPVARFMPSTIFHNPNDYATFLALGLPFVWAFIRYCRNHWQRLLGVLALLAGLYLLIATFSRANYLAVVVSAAFLFFLMPWNSRLKMIFGAGSIAIIVSVFFLPQLESQYQSVNVQLSSLETQLQSEEGSVAVRLNLIKNGLLFLWNTAGFGVGAGNAEYYMANSPVYNIGSILSLHNWWLENLVNYGIFVFAGYLIFFLGLVRAIFKAYRSATQPSERMICESLLIGLVAFCLASISSSSIMAFSPHWIFFAFALAFLNYCRTRQESSNP